VERHEESKDAKGPPQKKQKTWAWSVGCCECDLWKMFIEIKTEDGDNSDCSISQHACSLWRLGMVAEEFNLPDVDIQCIIRWKKKEKLRSILGCTSKPTLSVVPTTPVPASRLVRTVG
jgi:hypothetical protein